MTPNFAHKIVHSSAMYYQNLIIIHECSKQLLKMKNSNKKKLTPSMYVCMYVCMLCMYVCVYVCMYVCWYVYVICMYVSCMYVYMYIVHVND